MASEKQEALPGNRYHLQSPPGEAQIHSREHTASVTRCSINRRQRSEWTWVLFSITSHFRLPPVTEDLKHLPARLNQNSLPSSVECLTHPHFCFFHWNSIQWITVPCPKSHPACYAGRGAYITGTSALLYCQSPNRCWVLVNRSDFTDAGICILS